MSATAKADAIRKPDPGKCLARSVAQALAEDPTLEAVTVDQGHHTISVATLGKTDVPKLTERISATVRQAEESDAGQPCTQLSGERTCQTCGQPLSEFERRRITIRREADTTTIARMTCTTAPKFWRWRDIPWPKVVQRDVEFLEHAEEGVEWKAGWLPSPSWGESRLRWALWATKAVRLLLL
jgi:Cd2+/Zn2+-exporting ATPase